MVEELDGIVFGPIADPVLAFRWSAMTRAGDDRPELAAWRETVAELRDEAGW